ncbi:DUF881 domain-containing protein [Asanoa iriomotensis]|uniref:DUF881 domain-containing protein n=1 Tax=Asanoa iriomotensis TaxID=234613 RepID=A0ABQ4CA91_9ACTN|nr:DUF881 domain-containing protein [Asanoa iriomotensis]GIF59366.1 hypothetical protein Air01nite_54610 [Asanoa iriomotensis]
MTDDPRDSAADEPTARIEKPADQEQDQAQDQTHDQTPDQDQDENQDEEATRPIPVRPQEQPTAEKPARRPAPGRPAPARPAPPPSPEQQADAGPDEETIRLSPVTEGTTGEESPKSDEPVSDVDEPAPRRKRRGTAGVIILVLLALLGFTLAIQLRGKSVDSDLAAMREDDLVRLQSDLQAQDDRLRREIASLQDSQRQLQSGAQGRAAALEEATKRADELAILAGTAAATGPGLTIRFIAGPQPIAASDILNAVQELRGADAEAMQISGTGGGAPVRIVASTYFIDSDGGLEVSGRRLTGPYTITVIGDPPTMRTALNIPDGLVPSIKADGGNVIVDEHDTVDVTATAAPVDLKHAKPVS